MSNSSNLVLGPRPHRRPRRGRYKAPLHRPQRQNGVQGRAIDILVPAADTLCLAGLGSIPEEKRAGAKILGEVEVMPVDSKVASGEPFYCRTWLKMAIHQLDRARVIRLISNVGT